MVLYNKKMITERQEKILNALIKEYIDNAEPVSSKLLKERCGFICSSATIRNELQFLENLGLVEQPYTSAGRIPTEKAYKIFADNFTHENDSDFFSEFIFKEIKLAREQIEQELKLAEELTRSLEATFFSLDIKHTKQISEKGDLLEILTILGSSKPSHEKNIEIIKSLLNEFKM